MYIYSTYGQGSQTLTTATVTEGGSNEASNTLEENPGSADSRGHAVTNPGTQGKQSYGSFFHLGQKVTQVAYSANYS